MFKLDNLELIDDRLQVLANIGDEVNICRDKIKERWVEKINKNYKYLIVNLDGTLRKLENREGPIDNEIMKELKKIRKYNEIIVATGRRTSGIEIGENLVSNGLENFKMILGNGTEVISLPSKEEIYSVESFSKSTLEEIIDCLIERCGISEENICNSGNMLIRVFDYDQNITHEDFNEICTKINSICDHSKVTKSGLNFEITPRRTTKSETLEQIIPENDLDKILAIADSGYKNGNDFSILSNYSSFCVGLKPKRYIKWTLPVINKKGKILTGPSATKLILKHIQNIN